MFTQVLLIGIVPTTSMVPTIKEHQFILGNRLYKDYKIDDVIVFYKDGNFLVKRIAAIGGDKVTIKDKEVVVPENSFYLLGDNSEHSFDSRYWEEPFVNVKDVKAKVILPDCKRK